jgi:hypothetical protein
MSYTEVRSTNPYLTVDWILGNSCNYNCTYCNDDLKDGSSGWPDLSQALRFLDTLAATNRDIMLILSGGEPTLWRDLNTFVKEAKTRSAKIKLITNGFRKPSYWDSISANLDSVVFSLHTDQTPNIQQFINNFNSVLSEDKTVLLLAWPQSWDKVVDYHSAVKVGITSGSLQLKPVDGRWQGNSAIIDYTDRQLEWLANNMMYRASKYNNTYHPSYLINGESQEEIDASTIIEKKNSFYRWKCNIGIDKLTINQHGDIWGGTCGVGGMLGNFKNMDLILPTASQTCTMQYCNCMPDLLLSKHIDRESNA